MVCFLSWTGVSQVLMRGGVLWEKHTWRSEQGSTRKPQALRRTLPEPGLFGGLDILLLTGNYQMYSAARQAEMSGGSASFTLPLSSPCSPWVPLPSSFLQALAGHGGAADKTRVFCCSFSLFPME